MAQARYITSARSSQYKSAFHKLYLHHDLENKSFGNRDMTTWKIFAGRVSELNHGSHCADALTLTENYSH